MSMTRTKLRNCRRCRNYRNNGTYASPSIKRQVLPLHYIKQEVSDATNRQCEHLLWPKPCPPKPFTGGQKRRDRVSVRCQCCGQDHDDEDHFWPGASTLRFCSVREQTHRAQAHRRYRKLWFSPGARRSSCLFPHVCPGKPRDGSLYTSKQGRATRGSRPRMPDFPPPQ